MTKEERVRKVKDLLEQVTQEMQALDHEGVKIEFNIVDNKLARFLALAPIKYTS